jgi:hypothetical protein
MMAAVILAIQLHDANSAKSHSSPEAGAPNVVWLDCPRERDINLLPQNSGRRSHARHASFIRGPAHQQIFCTDPSGKNLMQSTWGTFGKALVSSIVDEALIDVACSGVNEAAKLSVVTASTATRLFDLARGSKARYEVQEDAHAQSAQDVMWSFMFGSQRQRSIQFSPWGTNCVGLSWELDRGQRAECSVSCAVRPARWRPLDPILGWEVYRFVLLLAGAALWHWAPVLSASAVFHYSSGAALGIVAGLVLILFFATRRMNNRWAWASLMVLGSGGYVKLLYDSVVSGAWIDPHTWRTYGPYVTGYLATAATITLAFMYWWLDGGRLGSTAQTIIQAQIRIVAVFFVYQSTATAVASLAALLLVSAVPIVVDAIARACNCRCSRHYIAPAPTNFTGRRRFLTQEEMREQSARATAKAMKKLYANPKFKKRLLSAMIDGRVQVTPGKRIHAD